MNISNKFVFEKKKKVSIKYFSKRELTLRLDYLTGELDYLVGEGRIN